MPEDLSGQRARFLKDRWPDLSDQGRLLEWQAEQEDVQMRLWGMLSYEERLQLWNSMPDYEREHLWLNMDHAQKQELISQFPIGSLYELWNALEPKQFYDDVSCRHLMLREMSDQHQRFREFVNTATPIVRLQIWREAEEMYDYSDYSQVVVWNAMNQQAREQMWNQLSPLRRARLVELLEEQEAQHTHLNIGQLQNPGGAPPQQHMTSVQPETQSVVRKL